MPPQLCECAHKWKDGELRVVAFDAAKSDVHVSIKEKRGKRALYYDLTLQMRWQASD